MCLTSCGYTCVLFMLLFEAGSGCCEAYRHKLLRCRAYVKIAGINTAGPLHIEH
jgi:hypothetical protein